MGSGSESVVVDAPLLEGRARAVTNHP